VLKDREPAWQHLTTCLAPVKAELDRELTETDYYQILEPRSVRLQYRISPILKALDFQTDAAAAALMQALQYFKTTDGKIGEKAPTDFLTPTEQDSVLGDRTVKVSLYKVFLFMNVMRAVKSGTLNIEQSYKYRPLDLYLIDRERWQRDRAVTAGTGWIASLHRSCRCPARPGSDP
jgi:hypothetical protein